MRAGLLPHRVVFQHRVQTQDSTGEVQWVWQDFRTVSAAVIPLSGQKVFAANQLQGMATHTIRVRYQAGYRTDQRIKYEQEPGYFAYFEIVYAPDVNSRHQWIDILAKQRESDGWQTEKGNNLSDLSSPAP